MPTSRLKIANSATSTVLLIPTSTLSYYGATLNMTTNYVQHSPGPSQRFSSARKVSSPLLQHHQQFTFPGTEGRYIKLS